MNHYVLSNPRGNMLRNLLVRTLLLCVAGSLFFAGVAQGQKDKKKKGKGTKTESTEKLFLPLPDAQAIDVAISEMLGAWQIGDIERMHQYYADDVVVVSGVWGPPVVGWNNYVQAYQSQRQRSLNVRLDRFNTSEIKVQGSVAWVCYLWEFAATVDDAPMVARGQTTLIFEKLKDHWMIVHNHTSLVQQTSGTQPAAPPASPAQKPPSGL